MQQVPNFWALACSICFNLICVVYVLFYCVNATVQTRNPISKAPNGIWLKHFMSPMHLELAHSSFLGESFYIKDKQPESWQPGQLSSPSGMGKVLAQHPGVHQGESNNIGMRKPCYIP